MPGGNSLRPEVVDNKKIRSIWPDFHYFFIGDFTFSNDDKIVTVSDSKNCFSYPGFRLASDRY
jgi:hypothetical protein